MQATISEICPSYNEYLFETIKSRFRLDFACLSRTQNAHLLRNSCFLITCRVGNRLGIRKTVLCFALLFFDFCSAYIEQSLYSMTSRLWMKSGTNLISLGSQIKKKKFLKSAWLIWAFSLYDTNFIFIAIYHWL